MFNNYNCYNKCFNCCNPICSKNCLYFKKCVKKGSALDSLCCVERFLCNSQKACNLYKIFCFFR
jgi:hypothetical protein